MKIFQNQKTGGKKRILQTKKNIIDEYYCYAWWKAGSYCKAEKSIVLFRWGLIIILYYN